MKRVADGVKGYNGSNPFNDSQARNFSDKMITSEFCPIANFWSLFNNQHEVLLGTRGCGKTVLLKMMRISMLKNIQDPKAEELVNKKNFISLYVPMHLEFVTNFTRKEYSDEVQVSLFQFAFNCLLAESLITELEAILDDIVDRLERAKKNLEIALAINNMWFNDDGNDINDLFSLSLKIKQLFYRINSSHVDLESSKSIFKQHICSPLIAIKDIVTRSLSITEDPTWIICIDEAEFLNEPLLKCINSVFRSDSNKITIKMATLPYYHKTLKTIKDGISVSPGNDFNYRVVDLDYDSNDFIKLTNTLCRYRLSAHMSELPECKTLEAFVGVIGIDDISVVSDVRMVEEDLIDYYRKEFGEEKSKREFIENEIIREFSDVRQKGTAIVKDTRKPVYDKFAPIYFVRQMYKLSRKGNSKPGWYAGSAMIRKLSQGNPRMFINLMNSIFEKAVVSELTPKAQHEVLLKYAKIVCGATQGLESNGPIVYDRLRDIAKYLHERAHGKCLIDAGASFEFEYNTQKEFLDAKVWLELAVAYSRLTVNSDTLLNGINLDTRFLFSNAYSAEYWLPMRYGSTPKIKHEGEGMKFSKMSVDEQLSTQQLSLFEEV